MQSSRTPIFLPPHEMITDIQNIMDRCRNSLYTLHQDDPLCTDIPKAKKQGAKFFEWTLEVNPLCKEQQSLCAQLKKAPEYGKPIYELLLALEDYIKLISE